MARPRKAGLDYFPFDVDFWDDYKIMDLLNRYGPLGVCIYNAVLCEVYKHGYYLEVPKEKLASQVMRLIGNRWIKDKTLVLQVIEFCADIGLFDHALLSQAVITSAGIQKRYSEVTVRNKVDKSKYWLLEKKDTHAALKNAPFGSVFVTETGVSATETRVSDEFIPQSKVKESKVKESKVKCVLRLPCRNGEFAVDEDLLADLTHTYPDMDVRKSLEKLCSYLISKPGKQGYVSSAEGYLRMWLADDDREGKYRKKQTDTYEGTYDLELYENSSAIDELEDNEDDT